MTWTSIVPDIRMTRLITEPRVSSCQRFWRLLPRISWVAFGAGEVDECRRDVASGDLVVLAAHLLEQLAVEREELGSRSDQALFTARVHAEQLPMGALGETGSSPDEVLRPRRTRGSRRRPVRGSPKVA